MLLEWDTDTLATAHLSQNAQPAASKGFPHHMCCPCSSSSSEMQGVTLEILGICGWSLQLTVYRCYGQSALHAADASKMVSAIVVLIIHCSSQFSNLTLI